MSRLLFALALGIAAAGGAAAQESLDDYAQSALLPDEIQGVKMYRPVSENGKMTVSEIIDIEQPRDSIFVGAILFVAEKLNSETDAIESVDFDSRRFVVRRSERRGEGKNAAVYSYMTAFQAADNILSFLSYDISVNYKEKGILPRTLDFEKLKADNKRHNELVEEFSFMNSKWIKDIGESISAGGFPAVAQWEEIQAGKVVKGMNASEVKLVLGRPLYERKTGKRVKWMYDNETVVIFTEGIVTTVID